MEKKKGDMYEFLKSVQEKMNTKVKDLGNTLNNIIEHRKNQQASSSSTLLTNEYMVIMENTL